jgi:hypothetical protein
LLLLAFVFVTFGFSFAGLADDPEGPELLAAVPPRPPRMLVNGLSALPDFDDVGSALLLMLRVLRTSFAILTLRETKDKESYTRTGMHRETTCITTTG